METHPQEITFEFAHYRIPEQPPGTRYPQKGSPPTDLLFRYFPNTDRRCKWKNYALKDVKPNSKGGATIIHVRVDGRLIASFSTYCSMSDNFCYKEGRRQAYKHILDFGSIPGMYKLIVKGY